MNITSLIKGVIFGQALGDAIGLTTEYMTKKDIEMYYTGKNIKLDKNYKFDLIVQDYHRMTWKAGDWTDDTDLLIVGLQSYIESNGKIDSYVFRNNLDKWYTTGIPECNDTKPHGCGYTMGMIWGDPYFKDDDISLTARRAYIYNPSFPCSLSSNGGIMRISWIATANYKNKDLLAYHTIQNCSITHCDPRCIASALFLNFMIAEILQENYNINDLLNKVINDITPYLKDYIKIFNIQMIRDNNNCKQSDPFYSVIKENYKFFKLHHIDNIIAELRKYVTMNNLEDLDLDNSNHMSYTFIPLATAVISLKKIINNNTDFITVIMDIVNCGGDSDTNCAVTGALCGALLGFEKLPQDLINTMPYKDFLENVTAKYIDVL
jgi:ADP-ribosylglycohydrolase